jgi:polysaccharide export outer membrane protein
MTYRVKLLQLALAIMAVIAMPAGLPAASAEDDNAYRINGGDTLHISVYGEQNLDKDVKVEPDGRLSFPLVGVVTAHGLTLQELQLKIADQLRQSQYFPNLTDNEVTVSMVQATGNSVSVIGQVKQAGTFNVDTRLDVMQVLSLAGGLTPFADKEGIRILRRDAAGVQKTIEFDYEAIEEGERLDENILLRGGDVVVVPQAGFGF